MRKKAVNASLSVQAIAGSYVVLLGIDMPEAKSVGVLGFAIERLDHTENERYWLKGFKTFQETDAGLPPGSLVTTLEQPIQAFLWSDFTAKPAHDYTYRVVAMRGKPKKLEQGETVEIPISTENEETGPHAVFFNRGVAGSQAYARKFHNQPPDKVPNGAAWDWLSRGLVEALLKFIGQANGPNYSLRAALYEFQYAPVLKAFAAARDAKADVKIVFDDKPNSQKEPSQKNEAAIAQAKIGDITIPRKASPSFISHNKFIVLLKDGKPTQVWTGSTNITDGGLFGHSNVGHIVRDPDIAVKYLAYWEQLSKDPEAKTLRSWTEKQTPVPKQTLKNPSITAIFSPRSSLEALEWYVKQMDASASSTFFTAAFGVNDLIKQVLETDKGYLRYVLLEAKDKDTEALRKIEDNRIAFGCLAPEGNALDQWQQEKTTGLNTHVKFIHTKYMLVDPLSDNPLVITGSANFSNASTTNNDENMLIIQGSKPVADIYLGEFMRLFNHFYVRNLMASYQDQPGHHSIHLLPDDSWRKDYYKKDSAKQKERIYFAG